MTRAKPRDPDWITAAEACGILAVSEGVFRRLVSSGHVTSSDRPSRRYSRVQVETVAADRAGWITTNEAAAILGVNNARVGQLVNAGRLPCVRVGRARRFRRTQVQVIANARNARWRPLASEDLANTEPAR